MKKTPGEGSGLLYESLLRLESVDECRRFLQDLCTVSELKAMEQRVEVAMYLREGMIYQDILKQRHHQPGEPLPAIWGRRLPNGPAQSGRVLEEPERP